MRSGWLTLAAALAAALCATSGCKENGAALAAGPKAQPRPVVQGSFPPNPLVSRGRDVESPQSGERHLTDGEYKASVWEAGRPTPAKPSWAAIDVGVGPKRLLVAWTSSGCFNYRETIYGGPGSYRIETSADSKDGEGGTWKTAVEVKDNAVRTRAHALDFEGQRWVRLSVTGPAKDTYQYGVQLDELDVHDASLGAQDTWFFMGDSITAMAFNRAKGTQPSFAEHVAKLAPGYFPLMLNGGIGGEKVDEGLAHLDEWLVLNPDVRHWAIGYGTNDSAGNSPHAAAFKEKLRTLVKRLKAAGKVPLLARIPYAPQDHDTVPAFNQAIDELTREEGLHPGPDLYAHFKANPKQLYDGLHPDEQGAAAINRLWAEAVAKLYAPRRAPGPGAQAPAVAPAAAPGAGSGTGAEVQPARATEPGKAR